MNSRFSTVFAPGAPAAMPNDSKPIVLVADDEPSMVAMLSSHLRSKGYTVLEASDGDQAWELAHEHLPNLVLLDVMMPGMNGFELLKRLRRETDTPVLMLTARAEVTERVAGLEAGADDYLVKPFAREELIARLRALLRRTGWEGDGELLRFEDLELDPSAHQARRGGRLLELTRTEFLLLELLISHPRQVLTRSTIFDHVWGYDFGPTSNSLEVYVGYLRRKTEAAGEPRLLQTVRGVGYVLRPAAR
jgi:two-component system response regulator MprA